MEYPEVTALAEKVRTYSISIERSSAPEIAERLVPVTVRVATQEWTLHIEDEYDDLSRPAPVMHFYLVLLSLEDYQETDDYLVWCSELMIDANNERLLADYRELGQICNEMEKILGNLETGIAHLHYELRSGPIQALLTQRSY